MSLFYKESTPCLAPCNPVGVSCSWALALTSWKLQARRVKTFRKAGSEGWRRRLEWRDLGLSASSRGQREDRGLF